MNLKKYIKNLDKYCAYDLIVTLSEKNKELEEKILDDFPYAKVKVCKNNKYGADIWPFFEVINSLDLDEYDLVFKLHTKQDFDEIKMRLPHRTKITFYIGNNIWRKLLLYSVLYKKNLKKCLRAFENNKKLGIWGFKPLLVQLNTRDVCPLYCEKLPRTKKKHFKFFAGTIFVTRAKILKCVQNIYTHEDFNTNDGQDKFALLAYQYESYFSQLALAQGYKIGGVGTKSDKFILEILAHGVLLKLYELYVKYRYNIEAF